MSKQALTIPQRHGPSMPKEDEPTAVPENRPVVMPSEPQSGPQSELKTEKLSEGLVPLPWSDAPIPTNVDRTVKFCIITLTMIAVLAVLYQAKAVVLPVVMSIFLALLFRPIVRALARRRIPDSVSAGILVAGLIAVIVVGFYELQGPATNWMRDAPNSLEKAAYKLRDYYKPIHDFEMASSSVEKIAPPGDASQKPVAVEIKQPSLSSSLVGTTTNMAAGAVLLFTLTYFLLATGDSLLSRVIQAMPTLSDKKRVVELIRNLEQAVSSYLFTVTMINIGLGVAEGIAMWLVGLPNPILWGVMAALLNFIPYVGGLVSAVVVFLVGVLTFDSLGQAALAPVAYVLINAIEGNFITPYLLGKSFSLNPIMVFLSLTLWSFIWGIGGMLLAIPLLAAFKITCDHFERSRPIGAMLAE